MTTLTMLIGLATLGVETGWQPVDDGALEYIIQIEPPLLDALRDGQPITSEIPAGLKGVRRYKIVVGKAPLPRTDLPATPVSAPAGPAPSAQGSPGTTPPPTASSPTGSLPGGSPLAVPPSAAAAAAAASPPDRYALPFSQAGVPVVPPAAGASGLPAAQGVAPNPPSSNPDPPGGVSFPSGSLPPAGPAATAPSTTPPATPGSILPAEVPPPPSARGEPTASGSPRPFQPDVKTADLAGGSLVAPQANRSPDTPEAGDQSESDHPVTEAGGEPSKPWLPLTMAMLVLFVSLSGNAFLGWAAWDARRHYRNLVRRTVGREPTSVVELPEDDPLIVGDGISSIHT